MGSYAAPKAVPPSKAYAAEDGSMQFDLRTPQHARRVAEYDRSLSGARVQQLNEEDPERTGLPGFAAHVPEGLLDVLDALNCARRWALSDSKARAARYSSTSKHLRGALSMKVT